MGASMIGAGVVGPVALVFPEEAGAGVAIGFGSGGKLHLTVPVLSRMMI